MAKYSREEWDDILQKLMTMMEDDYPVGYELVVNSFGAEIRSTLTDMCFTKKHALKDLHKRCYPVEERFDGVKAFEHMLSGKKVRRVSWPSTYYVEIKESKDDFLNIVDERGAKWFLSVILCKENRNAEWELFKEEMI